jgi:hypothetical protein
MPTPLHSDGKIIASKTVTGDPSYAFLPPSSSAVFSSMCCRTVSIASATMACSPVRPARLISQRLETYSASSRLNQRTRQLPRSSRSHCANHALTAAGRCASSRPSGVAKNRKPAHHPERPPHDETHVIIPRSYPEAYRGQDRHPFA